MSARWMIAPARVAATAVAAGAVVAVLLSACDDSGDPVDGDGYDQPVVQVDPYGHTHTVYVTPPTTTRHPATPRGGQPTRRTVVQPRPAAPKQPAAPRPAAPKPAPPKIKTGK